MARPPAYKKYGRLLRWHLSHQGTRPDGITRVWTVKEFAKAVDLNVKTIQNWLDGRNLPADMGRVEDKLFGDNPDYEKWKRELRDARVAAPPPPPGPDLIEGAAVGDAGAPAPESPGPAPAEGAAPEAIAGVPSPPGPANPNPDRWITTPAQVPRQPRACIPEVGIGELVEEGTVSCEELAPRMAEAQQKIGAAKAPWWHAATVSLPLCALTLLGISGDGRTFFDLCITVPQKLATAPFKVRHVRDGVGELNEPPYFLNNLLFPPPDRSGRTCQTLWFQRHFGAMFKAYVSFDGMEFEDVKKILEDNHYTDVTQDFNRAWFLTPGYRRYPHANGTIIDNSYLDE